MAFNEVEILSEIKKNFEIQSILTYIRNQRIIYGRKDYSKKVTEIVLQLIQKYIISSRVFFTTEYKEESEETIAKQLKKLRRIIFINKYDFREVVFHQFETVQQYFDCKIKESDYIHLFSKVSHSSSVPDIASFDNFVLDVKRYSQNKTNNIIVCGTISAGKSSFINSLLGTKLLPSKNEATTAKITSIFNSELNSNFCGCYINHKNEVMILNESTRSVLQKLNEETDVSQVFIHGKYYGIKNTNGTVILHDTPGTNNGVNETHLRITTDFLNRLSSAVLVFVANSCYLRTQDEKNLLSIIFDLIKDKDIRPIFVLNQADKIDPKIENLDDIYKTYEVYLEEIGFKKPRIFFSSAKTALLCKLLLQDDFGSLSESDKDNFIGLYNKFTERMNLSKEKEPMSYVDGYSLLDGEKYEKKLIWKAYNHSGIYDIEQYIEKIINGEKNED